MPRNVHARCVCRGLEIKLTVRAPGAKLLSYLRPPGATLALLGSGPPGPIRTSEVWAGTHLCPCLSTASRSTLSSASLHGPLLNPPQTLLTQRLRQSLFVRPGSLPAMRCQSLTDPTDAGATFNQPSFMGSTASTRHPHRWMHGTTPHSIEWTGAWDRACGA